MELVNHQEPPKDWPVVEILLEEDNSCDVHLTLEAFKEGKLVNNLSVVGDGGRLWPSYRKGKYIRIHPNWRANRLQNIVKWIDINTPIMGDCSKIGF